LVQLDLSYNKFSGEIPQDRFTGLKCLKWLNLSNCNFLESEKSHRQLEQALPIARVHVHVPRREYKPSPLPTFPRKGSKYQEYNAESSKAATSTAGGDSINDDGSLGMVEGQSDVQALPDVNDEGQTDHHSGEEEEEDEEDDDEEDDDEEDE